LERWRRVGIALLAAGGGVASLVYAARAKFASAVVAAYHIGKSLIHRAGMALARLLPVYAFGGT
jgi:hypothetical protein